MKNDLMHRLLEAYGPLYPLREEAAYEIQQLRSALIEMSEWIAGPVTDHHVPILEPPSAEEFQRWYSVHIDTINRALIAREEEEGG